MLPPKGAAAYFSSAADAVYRRAHPIGYKLMTVLGIAALCGPMIAWIVWIAASAGRLDGTGAWSFVGWLGTFLIGIGLFNFVAILLKQYLGHLLSILCFLIGGGLVGLNLVFLL